MNRPGHSARRNFHFLERLSGQAKQLGAVPSMAPVQRNPAPGKNRLPACQERRKVIGAPGPKPAEEFVFQVGERRFISGARRFQIQPRLIILVLAGFGWQRLVRRSNPKLARLGFDQRPEHAPQVVCESRAVRQILGARVAALRTGPESGEDGQQGILNVSGKRDAGCRPRPGTILAAASTDWAAGP